MESKSIIIFTDGACSKNGKKNATAGIGIHFPNKEFNDISEVFNLTPVTNQRAELYAIYVALKKVTEAPNFNKAIIYSDSQYSIKSVTLWIKNWEKNDWKTANGQTVKNQDIIKPINDILKKHKRKITFKHVRSHTGDTTFEALSNEKADKLACSVTQTSLGLTAQACFAEREVRYTHAN